MRLLVHGMQSSGATTFALFLAQRPGTLALVDTPNNFAVPRVTSPLDFIAKAVITTAYPLAVHVERFRPDRVILFLRDPRDNHHSLQSKPYRHYSGLMDEKFVILDQLFAEPERFDAIVHYEDFVRRDAAILARLGALGWPVEERYFDFAIRHDEILAALWKHEPGWMDKVDFVFGNVRGRTVTTEFRDKPRDPEAEARLEQLCPRVLAHYRRRDAAPAAGP
jgi:hypothetical protein